VHFGALMACTYGTCRSALLLSSPQAVATAGDHFPLQNILPFGRCLSHRNPGYVPDTYIDPYMDVSLELDFESPPGCIVMVKSPWLGMFTKPGPFDPSQPIDQTAYCVCQYGGRISFV
jgi:hypothetical protein